jgi:hypothetical protein
MLVSKTVWWILVFVCGAGALGCMGWFKAISDDRGRRQWLAGLAALGAIALTLFVYFAHGDVIVVTERGGSVRAERQIDLGASSDETIVRNGSSHDLRVVEREYGAGIGFGTDPIRIAPGAEVKVHGEIQYLGPTNPPPSSITVDSKLPFAYRQWLTWD